MWKPLKTMTKANIWIARVSRGFSFFQSLSKYTIYGLLYLMPIEWILLNKVIHHVFEYHNGIKKKWIHIQTFIPFQINDFLQSNYWVYKKYLSLKWKTKNIVWFQKGFGLCMNIEYLVKW